MSRKFDAFGVNGALVNPPGWLFDPFLQLRDDQLGTLLYRVRRLSSSFLEQEIVELGEHGRTYVSTLDSLNDLHEGLPDLSHVSKPLRHKARDALKVSASSALNQAKYFGTGSRRELLRIFGTQGYFTQDTFDYFLQPYFQDPLFLAASNGDKFAAQMALMQVRRSIRVSCFSLDEPGSYHWGQYGDNGRGICFEIEDRYDKAFFSPLTPQPVEYIAEKPIIDLNAILTALIFVKIIENWELSDMSFQSRYHPFLEAIRSIVFTKEDTWSQERECRLITLSGRKGGYVSLDGLKLKRVILGPGTLAEDLRWLREVIQRRNLKVPIAKMSISSGYKLEVRDLD